MSDRPRILSSGKSLLLIFKQVVAGPAVTRWWMSLGAAASITVALAGCGRPLGGF